MHDRKKDQMDGQMDRWTVRKMVYRFNGNKNVLVDDKQDSLKIVG